MNGTDALSDYIFASKYSKHLVEENRRETYSEAVTRVMDMHRAQYGASLDSISDLITAAEKALLAKEVCGSQRNMQYGGKPVLDKNARSYNCSSSYCDRPRFFAEAFWLLLCGCGVGFSVQKQHVAKLPAIVGPGKRKATVFVVPDTIEGWSDALDVLLKSYFYANDPVKFDFSEVRPEGSTLSSGAGFAPGPKPLREALEAVRKVLDSRVGKSLRTIDAYDIVMHVSCAVLSGGVRRSATIALFSVDDVDMMTAKSPANYDPQKGLNAQRARSNNSAMLLRGGTTLEQFRLLVETAKKSGGEPGFYWVDSLDLCANPCLEISFVPQWRGRSCWHLCNLSSINGAKATTAEAFYRACAAAATLGTLQAGYTLFPYLGPDTEALVRYEGLLGVSITGVQDSPLVCLSPETLAKGVAVIEATNRRVAAAIGIRPAARLTALKPEGTTSALLGTASGKHRRHAHRYFRGVQANALELPAIAFAKANPGLVEKSVWHEGDLFLRFPIEAPIGALLRKDESALEQLADVVLLKRAWVNPGRMSGRCNHRHVENNVSNTVTVKDQEWEAAIQFIYFHRQAFAGVSLLPASGDLDYAQAPFVSVDETNRTELAEEWVRLAASLKPVDYSKSVPRNLAEESACAGGACEIL